MLDSVEVNQGNDPSSEPLVKTVRVFISFGDTNSIFPSDGLLKRSKLTWVQSLQRSPLRISASTAAPHQITMIVACYFKIVQIIALTFKDTWAPKPGRTTRTCLPDLIPFWTVTKWFLVLQNLRSRSQNQNNLSVKQSQKTSEAWFCCRLHRAQVCCSVWNLYVLGKCFL